MKKLLVCSVVSLICVPTMEIWAMESDFSPPFEAVCANEIVSGIQQKSGGNVHPNFITRIDADGIAQRKKLLRVWRKSDKNLHDIDRKSVVTIYYVDVSEIPEGIEMMYRGSKGRCNVFTAKLTPEQVVMLWETFKVDKKMIPNKNWKQDLEDVKGILGLSVKSKTMRK